VSRWWVRVVSTMALVVATTAVALSDTGAGRASSAPDAATASGPRWPTTTANRKVVDQFGDPFPLKIMSAWGMAQRLTNSEITRALEGLKAQGFNAVNVAGVGGVNVQSDWTADQYENRAGSGFFTGTAFQSSLGSGMASTDWIQSESERLGMVLVFSFFVSYGESGSGPAMTSATNGQMRTVGQDLATRYREAPNIVWHIEADTGWGPGDSIGRRLDSLFRGITETQSSARITIAEPFLGGDGNGMFIAREGTDPTGYQWLHLSTDALYQYEDDSVVQADAVWANTSTYPVWDSEPPYAKATDKYGGNFHQQLRERNYSVFIRGYSGINYGDEDFWRFGLTGFYDGGDSWQDVLTNTETTEARYAWDIVDRYITDATWARSSTFVTTGVGTADTKAAVGSSDTAALAYFPSARSVNVDTTVIAGSEPVRLRWYDPTSGRFADVSTSEPQQPNRSVAYPAAHPDGSSDWVLVVDLAGAPTTTTTPPTTTLPPSAPAPPAPPPAPAPAPAVLPAGDGPGAVSAGPGELDVFARGVDDRVWTRHFDGTSWSGWSSLGGIATSAPAAASRGPGGIDLFVRGTDNALWTRSFDGASWSAWSSLGGVLSTGATAVSRAPGTIDVFAGGGDFAVWQRSFDGSSWGGWGSLGGLVTATPAAASAGSGSVVVFGRGGDNALWARTFDGSAWSWWSSLGGFLTSAPSAASRCAGCYDVFVRGGDNALWGRTLSSGWSSVGGILSSPATVASAATGSLDVFARGTDTAMWANHSGGGGFTGWYTLGGLLR
jgi:hypothetical protein